MPLSIDKIFLFLSKPHKPACRRQDAKDLLRPVYFSLKMGEVEFLCGLPAAEGLAPLRDKKIVKSCRRLAPLGQEIQQ
jgi:hypothetical protein